MVDPGLLRRSVPGPTPEAIEAARLRLRHAIAAERSGRVRRPRLNWAAAAAAVIAVVALAAGLVLLSAQPAAEAGLQRIATAIEEIPATELPSGSYHYTRADQSVLTLTAPEQVPGSGPYGVGLMLTQTREVWRAEDGSILERLTTTEVAVLDPEMADEVAASGLLNGYDIGESSTAAYPPDPGRLDVGTLPVDPDLLEEWMQEQVTMGRIGQEPEPGPILDLAVDVLTDPCVSPQLRAAVLRVLAATDGLAFSEGEETGTIAVAATTVADGRPLRRTVVIDADGRVVESTVVDVGGLSVVGLAPGSVVAHIRYAPPQIVAELPG